MNDDIILSNMETVKHIHRVRELLYTMISKLDERARLHDLSKLQSPEQEIFGSNFKELATVEYGTPAYEAMKVKVQPAIDHHYANNRHHPEHHKDGVNDMTLIDMIEMLCDWRASSERNKNGNIRKSIDINAERYNIGEQLRGVLENTVKEIF
jgi:G3E family GTPase